MTRRRTVVKLDKPGACNFCGITAAAIAAAIGSTVERVSRNFRLYPTKDHKMVCIDCIGEQTTITYCEDSPEGMGWVGKDGRP